MSVLRIFVPFYHRLEVLCLSNVFDAFPGADIFYKLYFSLETLSAHFSQRPAINIIKKIEPFDAHFY